MKSLRELPKLGKGFGKIGLAIANNAAQTLTSNNSHHVNSQSSSQHLQPGFTHQVLQTWKSSLCSNGHGCAQGHLQDLSTGWKQKSRSQNWGPIHSSRPKNCRRFLVTRSSFHSTDGSAKGTKEVPKAACKLAYLTKSASLHAVGDLTVVTFYFLLRSGNNTKPQKVKKNKKWFKSPEQYNSGYRMLDSGRMEEFCHNTHHWNYCWQQMQPQWKFLIKRMEARAKPFTRNQTLHQESTGPTGNVAALMKWVHHILPNGGTKDQLICDIFSNSSLQTAKQTSLNNSKPSWSSCDQFFYQIFSLSSKQLKWKTKSNNQPRQDLRIQFPLYKKNVIHNSFTKFAIKAK